MQQQTLKFEIIEANFFARLGQQVTKPLKWRVNDNHSTMVSVRWEADVIHLSLHRLFLSCPVEVFEKLAIYLNKEKGRLPREVRSYMEEQIRGLDYSHQLKKEEIVTQGVVHNLQAIYDRVNQTYFGGSLSLAVTWYGIKRRRYKRRLTFGLYDEVLKLIKIHRMLDSTSVPEYVVEYVIYHEALHYVCPPFIDHEGVSRIHHFEFKKREQLYPHYKSATEWMRIHRATFFN